MSYPYLLNILIVEDNPSAKDGYEDDFRKEVKDHGTRLNFAFCLDDAVAMLSADVPYHVVLTDLRIPESQGLPEPAHADFGMQVIELCERRDRWPVPSILVVSGHLDPSLQAELEPRLHSSFGYSAVRNRGDINVDLKKACDYARRYCEVGITHHINRDGAACALSMREEDLLRRIVVEAGCAGLELNDWSFARTASRKGVATKVYVGRFFDRGYDPGAVKFMKFMPRADWEYVGPAAEQLALRLPHARVFSKASSASRSVLITEKAGMADSYPRSIHDMLRKDVDFVSRNAPELAKQVATQLSRLGQMTANLVLPGKLLCRSQDVVDGVPAAEVCRAEMVKHRGAIPESALEGPQETLRTLLTLQTHVRVKERTAHGDLNVGNVALDIFDETVEGFIFDPGFMTRDVAVRDLAFLEVSLLLHLPLQYGSLPFECSVLYDNRAASTQDPTVSNVISLVTALRVKAFEICEPRIYAACVFDHAFGQVWGLKFSGSQNKIKSFSDAVQLLLLVSDWTRRLWSPDPLLEAAEEGPDF